MPGSTVDGVSFTGIGELPAWLTASPPPDDVHVWIGGAWVIDREREAARLLALRDRALESLPVWEKSERAAGIEQRRTKSQPVKPLSVTQPGSNSGSLL